MTKSIRTAVANGDKRWSIYVLSYVVLVAVHHFIPPFSDDQIYAGFAQEMGLFSFLQMFYATWSGRIVSNALTFVLMGGQFWLWRLLNPAVLLLLAHALARAASAKVLYPRFLLSLFLILAIHSRIVSYGIFWATGSLYYLWPITGAVFLLIPFFDLALGRGEGIKGRGRVFYYILLAACCSLCNEQVTLCVVGFQVVFLLYTRTQKRRIPLGMWATVAASTAAAIILFAAPGNQVRFAQEMEMYFPNFFNLSLREHIALGATWLFDMLTSLLLPLLLAVYASALRKRWTQLWAPWKVGYGLVFAVALCVTLYGANEMPLFFGGQGVVSGQLDKVFHMFPYVFWTVFVVTLACLLLRAHVLYGVGFVAAVCSLLILCFSPTLHVSGHRTLLVAGVILTGMLLALTKDRCQTVPIGLAGAAAAVNLAAMGLRFLQGMG